MVPNVGDQVTLDGGLHKVEFANDVIVRTVDQQGRVSLAELHEIGVPAAQVAGSLFPGSTYPIVGDQVQLVDRSFMKLGEPSFFDSRVEMVGTSGQLVWVRNAAGEVRDLSILHLKRVSDSDREACKAAVLSLVNAPMAAAIGQVADKLVLGGVALRQRAE